MQNPGYAESSWSQEKKLGHELVVQNRYVYVNYHSVLRCGKVWCVWDTEEKGEGEMNIVSVLYEEHKCSDQKRHCLTGSMFLPVKVQWHRGILKRPPMDRLRMLLRTSGLLGLKDHSLQELYRQYERDLKKLLAKWETSRHQEAPAD